MNKKGMETMQIIVGLVIALVAAVLIIVALTGKFQNVQKFASCGGQGGTCQSADTPCPSEKPATLYTDDCREGVRCCIAGG